MMPLPPIRLFRRANLQVNKRVGIFQNYPTADFESRKIGDRKTETRRKVTTDELLGSECSWDLLE